MNFRILHRCDGMVAASSILLQILLSASSANASREGTSQDLRQMFEVMEQNTLDWARHMESLLLDKCNATTIQACSEGNYNGCLSEFPYATCPGAENRILACGKGNEGGCSGLMDFTASKVSLAKEDVFSSIRNPTDREKDGVCSSRAGDEFIRQEREKEETINYWGKYKVSPPW